MTDSDSTAAYDGSATLFRPSKRRKTYRQRGANEHEPTSNNAKLEVTSAPMVSATDKSVTEPIDSAGVMTDDDSVEHVRMTVTEILRLRKNAKARHNGIEFRARSRQNAKVNHQTQVEVSYEENGVGGALEEQALNRFAPQTGTKGGEKVDKHMMEYIDQELAKRRHERPLFTEHEPTTVSGTEEQGRAEIRRQPATLGKLQEIDLGPEASLRNIQRTEEAKRRMEGGLAELDVLDAGTRKGKGRGRRRRRNSEDLRRDKLVEEVLRESRLDIYDPTTDDALMGDDAQGADDRVAEQFRREFMDAVQSRKRTGVATNAPPPGKPVKKGEERPKGPKLGGSRSARAAMKEILDKQEKKGGK